MSDSTRTLLVGATGASWPPLVAAMRAGGHVLEEVDANVEPTAVATEARRGSTVVVVDLTTDLLRGMEVISACRRQATAAPVIVVAPDLSVALARTIRAAGVFYLAIHPIGLEELSTALANALASLARNRASASTCQTRAKVLIVDDDPDFTAAVAALLEGDGYVVLRAGSGKEGLEKVMLERPDLLVLDIMMEDAWAGYLVNQAVKFKEGFEEVRNLPILMVSSVPVDPATRFSGAGDAAMVTPDAYLTKPIDSREFLSLVKLMIRRPGGAAQP